MRLNSPISSFQKNLQFRKAHFCRGVMEKRQGIIGSIHLKFLTKPWGINSYTKRTEQSLRESHCVFIIFFFFFSGEERWLYQWWVEFFKTSSFMKISTITQESPSQEKDHHIRTHIFRLMNTTHTNMCMYVMFKYIYICNSQSWLCIRITSGDDWVWTESAMLQ